MIGRILAIAAVPGMVWIGYKATMLLWSQDGFIAFATAATFFIATLESLKYAVNDP